jgi:hypothetical protein
MSRAGREREQLGVEPEVLFCEVEGRGKVLRDVANF